MSKSRPQSVSTEPLKPFFVDMLTRDIDLEDAILDLLDNCVDGVIRSVSDSTLTSELPYTGRHAEIVLSRKEFIIVDNCGGIPLKRLNYAFAIGKGPSPEDLKRPTVGTYGIGMKRAIFKMGRDAVVETVSGHSAFRVNFAPGWFKDEKNWDVPVRYTKIDLDSPGTRIVVRQLVPHVAKQLGSASFQEDLRERIATQYAFILNKGFSVSLNGIPVEPRPIRLRFADPSEKGGVRPFLFRRDHQGVSVFLAVGFTAPIPSQDEANSESGEPPLGRYRSIDAGWTIVCNDRTVVYADKTMLTGWGDSDVPRYHPQFIAIAGIVEFRSNDARKLPTTTTKRGIDASSDLYLEVKNKMREGLKLFTSYTNRWKSHEVQAEGKRLIEDAEPLSFSQLRTMKTVRYSPVSKMHGEQYKPSLPVPKRKHAETIRISFERPEREVQKVAAYLLGDRRAPASSVGNACFEEVLREAAE